MQFNSLLFLFLFLPLSLALALVSGKKIRNISLLLLSLIFYAWGGVSTSIILILSIIFNYLAGIVIGKISLRAKAKVFLITAVTLNVLLLVFFKYLTFLVANLNDLLALTGSAPVLIKQALIPLGISFFTFTGIAYLVDIYRGETQPEKNFIRFALFLSFFPRIISGPIVRYNDMLFQLTGRKITPADFAAGAERFIIGLGKKVLIADVLAVAANYVFLMPERNLTFYYAWIGIISYALQVYIDFSGYSDMAIGLGKMFGFSMPENFNLPYLAKSLQEFWQRWHITLSAWLRDYLFTPLSLRFRNLGKASVVISLLITFTLCGLWHNAGWGFVVWGLFHGVFLALESLGLGTFLKRIWKPFRHIYLLLVVIFGWVFFRSPDLGYALKYCAAMVNFSGITKFHGESKLVDNYAFILSFVLAVAGSAGVFAEVSNYFKKLSMRVSTGLKGFTILSYSLFEMAALFVILVLATSFIAANNYVPFIYFRF